jgi:hypothetical protein
MGSGTSYILEGGSSESQLASNAGKRVEVTGTLDTSMSGHTGTSSTGGAGTTGTTGSGSTGSGSTGSATGSGSTGSGSMSSAQHLRVSSVRVVGESCQQ